MAGEHNHGGNPYAGTIYEGLDAAFAKRLESFVAASGGRIKITSGYRSVEHQTRLWNDAIRKYGSEAAARKWVAPPGKSNHNHGIAADLDLSAPGAREWAHANAIRFGMYFPMSWEPWHIQPLKATLEENPEAYTEPPKPPSTVGISPMA